MPEDNCNNFWLIWQFSILWNKSTCFSSRHPVASFLAGAILLNAFLRRRHSGHWTFAADACRASRMPRPSTFICLRFLFVVRLCCYSRMDLLSARVPSVILHGVYRCVHYAAGVLSIAITSCAENPFNCRPCLVVCIAAPNRRCSSTFPQTSSAGKYMIRRYTYSQYVYGYDR